ncbi:transposase [Streptomyces sp. NPDC003710]
MGDNPERLNTEASVAALCGVSPVEYSSGRRTSRRPMAATGKPTPPCTASCSPDCATTRAPRRTTNAAPGKARPGRSSDASDDTPPERPSTWSERHPPIPRYRGSRET